MLVKDGDVYVIAEIGINHNGDMEEAKRLITKAKMCGVNAVKFQTYLTEERVARDHKLYPILKKCELRFVDFFELEAYANYLGLDFFSTPFGDSAFDFLTEKMYASKIKVSSFDLPNKELLEKINKSKVKTVFLSTGMADYLEIRNAVTILEGTSLMNKTVALLHCVSAYPTELKDANLRAIKTLKHNFAHTSLKDRLIGLSDHTPDIRTSIYAVAMGARVIEKHFKMHNDCPDAAVSINAEQMHTLVQEIKGFQTACGSGKLGLTKAQASSEEFRNVS